MATDSKETPTEQQPPLKMPPSHSRQANIQTDCTQSSCPDPDRLVNASAKRPNQEEARRSALTSASLATALQEQVAAVIGTAKPAIPKSYSTRPNNSQENREPREEEKLMVPASNAKRPREEEREKSTTADSRALGSEVTTALVSTEAVARGKAPVASTEEGTHKSQPTSSNSQDDALSRKPTEEEMLMALQHHWNVLYQGGQVSTSFPVSLLPPSLRPETNKVAQPPPSDGKSIMAVRPAKKKRKVAAHQHYKDLATQYLRNSHKPSRPAIPTYVSVPSDWKMDAPEYLAHYSNNSAKKARKSVRFATRNILGLAVLENPNSSSTGQPKPKAMDSNPAEVPTAGGTANVQDCSCSQEPRGHYAEQERSLESNPKSKPSNSKVAKTTTAADNNGNKKIGPTVAAMTPCRAWCAHASSDSGSGEGSLMGMLMHISGASSMGSGSEHQLRQESDTSTILSLAEDIAPHNHKTPKYTTSVA